MLSLSDLTYLMYLDSNLQRMYGPEIFLQSTHVQRALLLHLIEDLYNQSNIY